MSAHLVSCELASALGGSHPPGLDSLIEMRLATILKLPKIWRTDRNPPSLFETHSERVPIVSTRLGRWAIGHVSECIMSDVEDDRHSHFHRRFPVNESAKLLSHEDRSMVATANNWTKSYRLPLRVRLVPRLLWIAELSQSPSELLKLLKGVTHIGTKHAHGYGAIVPGSWKCEPRPDLAGQWWYGKHPDGPVLMRPLPIGPWLPGNLQGARTTYAACVPPYWHPDRYTEVVEPC